MWVSVCVCVCKVLLGRLFFCLFIVISSPPPRSLCLPPLTLVFSPLITPLFSRHLHLIIMCLCNCKLRKYLCPLPLKSAFFHWRPGVKLFFKSFLFSFSLFWKSWWGRKQYDSPLPAFTASVVTTSCFPARGFRPSRHRALGVNTAVMCVCVGNNSIPVWKAAVIAAHQSLMPGRGHTEESACSMRSLTHTHTHTHLMFTGSSYFQIIYFLAQVHFWGI